MSIEITRKMKELLLSDERARGFLEYRDLLDDGIRQEIEAAGIACFSRK
jgi:hypothetical protein